MVYHKKIHLKLEHLMDSDYPYRVSDQIGFEPVWLMEIDAR